MIQVRRAQVYLSGGRTGWAERLIHFGTRRGALGLYVGIPLFVATLALAAFWSPWPISVWSYLLIIWIIVSGVYLEGKTWADHCMFFVEDGELGQALAVQASIGGGVSFARPQGTAPRWVIYEVPQFTEEQIVAMVARAHALVAGGFKYRMKLNVAFGMDYCLGLGLFEVHLFRHNLVAKAANVCSALVWRLPHDEHVPGFETDPQEISPDDIDDIGRKRWVLAAEGGG
jgi:hypothetical protein